jgi:hypothetical protein
MLDTSIVRVGGSKALGENVCDAGTLHYRAYRPAGNYTSSGSGGLHENSARAMRADDLMGNRAAGHRDADHVAACSIHRLAHCFGDFVRLAGRETNAALTISHRDERVEGKAASALHDLRDTVDRDHVLDELAATISASAVTVSTFAFTAPTAAA